MRNPAGKSGTTRQRATGDPASRGTPARGAPARSTRGQAAKERAATFRRRRAVVGVLALLLVAGVAFGAVQGVPLLLERFGPSSAEPTSEPTEDSTGPDEEALANPVGCQSEAVSLELGSAGGTVAAGSQVEVPVTITNTGQVPCLLDVGNASLELAVTSGDDTVWTTAQCPAGREEQRILLATGAVEERTITWSGRRSAAECPSDTREARAGAYRVQVSLAVDDGAVTERQALTLN
ncbi:MAG TPA: hypothetical protein H9815_09600 [Candidatus Ruania gallistercoris]|uniref:DUF4232 domain-containing protein n=1 Tax=Candidatus Ruania gallistercoris TaxID=2838746 RepID=A0A9D2EEA3_9MICO|nr:hypothetical protein [Candidatus Ruania gallistercoris]